MSFDRVLISPLGILTRGRQVLFGHVVSALTVLVRRLILVMSSGSLMRGGCIKMFGGRVSCPCPVR
jgi:hypothetical protein